MTHGQVSGSGRTDLRVAHRTGTAPRSGEDESLDPAVQALISASVLVERLVSLAHRPLRWCRVWIHHDIDDQRPRRGIGRTSRSAATRFCAKTEHAPNDRSTFDACGSDDPNGDHPMSLVGPRRRPRIWRDARRTSSTGSDLHSCLGVYGSQRGRGDSLCPKAERRGPAKAVVGVLSDPPILVFSLSIGKDS
jgi:hypothetical protein